MAALVFNSLSLIKDIINYIRPPPNIPKYGLPIPPHPHIVITREKIGDRPILIVGDIHGCFDELQELIKQAKNITNSNDIFLVCVGDMLNKGPKTLEVLRFLRRWTMEGNSVAVRGNHEESLLRECRNMEENPEYILPPKYQYLIEFAKQDFDYLKDLPYTVRIPKIRSLIVHAGILPGIPVEEQLYMNLTHMRNLIYMNGLFSRSVEGASKITEGIPWATKYEGPEHIYFGHDARRGLQDLPHATGLDTGCVYGKSLTGVIIDINNQKQFISIEAKKVYYPPEPAKNENL